MNFPQIQPQDPGKKQAQLAERQERQGLFKEAAATYWEIANSKLPPEQYSFRLRAVEAVLHSETRDLARQYLALIDEKSLTTSQLVRKRVAIGKLHLLDGHPQETLAKVPLELAQSAPEYKPHILALRANALAQTNQQLASVKTRIQLGPLLTQQDQKTDNANAIWQSLVNSNIEDLTQWRKTAKDPILLGWLKLASVYKKPFPDIETVQRELALWKHDYPNHPAPNQITEQMIQDWNSLQLRPTRIAVLLPMSGQHSDLARAIYAGITAAREDAPATGITPPTIALYDVGDNDSLIQSYYQKAVQEGADFVIGPLSKPAVQLLANESELTVPTLTLNYLDELSTPPANLFQFGLLPEDEARQVAERASIEGLQTALVIVPDAEWGDRLADAFSVRYQELGGVVLQIEHYSPETTDYSDAIKRLLKIDESERRWQSIQNLIQQEVQFEPRRRQDVDMIFVGASPKNVRLLRPQISYYYATDLPVYSTSHIYSGIENVAADQDLNNVQYCDVPWLLNNDPATELLRETVELASPDSQRLLPRFVALGIDAYQVIPHLKTLAVRNFERVSGATGKLSVSDNNRIYRELSWAQFDNGKPRLIKNVGNATSQTLVP